MPYRRDGVPSDEGSKKVSGSEMQISIKELLHEHPRLKYRRLVRPLCLPQIVRSELMQFE
jgi:hypothetical protein